MHDGMLEVEEWKRGKLGVVECIVRGLGVHVRRAGGGRIGNEGTGSDGIHMLRIRFSCWVIHGRILMHVVMILRLRNLWQCVSIQEEELRIF